MAIKYPRLAVNWPAQPDMMRRYWDIAMTALEKVGTFTGTIFGTNGVDFDNTTGEISLDPTDTMNTDHAAVILTAGIGLDGGGDITASRTFDVSPVLQAYNSGDTPSAFTLSIVDSTNAAAWRAAIGAGTSSAVGTVTSVAMTVPTGFTIAGTPITSTGTLAVSYDSGFQGYTTAESVKLAGIAPGATANTGTVTSVAFSGGTTGLTASGSPVTTSGTFTLSGTLVEANGGTGTTTGTGTGPNVRATKPQFTNTIGVGVAAAASGSGVSFPATQAASTDPNTLDDYEEGTYTPVAVAGSGSITTYTSSGSYVKVGRLVVGRATVAISNNGTGGSHVGISLPFTAAADGPFIAYGRETAATGSMLQGLIVSSTGDALVYTYANAYPGGTGYSLNIGFSYYV